MYLESHLYHGLWGPGASIQLVPRLTCTGGTWYYNFLRVLVKYIQVFNDMRQI